MRTTPAFATRIAAAALVLLAFSARAVPAPSAPDPAAAEAPLRAVAGVFPPFLMQEYGKLTGFSIDLWNAVASKLGRPTTIALVPETASLTYEQFRGLISGPDDLAGKVVATQAGSTSVDHLRELGARIDTFPTPEEAYAALLGEEVDAVVLAAPGLRHYEVGKGSGRVKVVGPEFRKSDLGFMVPLHSPLRRQVDSALVALRADGTYERLREKWFGRG